MYPLQARSSKKEIREREREGKRAVAAVGSDLPVNILLAHPATQLGRAIIIVISRLFSKPLPGKCTMGGIQNDRISKHALLR